MNFNTTISLDNLHCVSPADSGGDDPYLWAFYSHIDGNSVRQSASDPFRLSANVSITSGTGRPGNLNVEGIDGGANVHIPSNIGQFATTLKPIELQFGVSSGTIRVFMPGQVIAYAVVIAEEGVPRHISSGIHDDVRVLVEERVNDFLNGLNLLPLSITAITQGPAAMRGVLVSQINDFITNLKQEVKDYIKTYAELAVLSEWWNPLAQIATALDPDEPIGKGVNFTFGEDQIIADNLSEHPRGDLRQEKTGLGGGWYIIDGHLDADVHFSPTDLPLVSTQLTSTPTTPQSVTFQKDHLMVCITAGTTVELTAFNHTETYGYAVQYPFANYRYTIEGQVLSGNSGSIALTKTVHVQEFDENATSVIAPFIKNVDQNRSVTIQFSKVRRSNDPQIELLVLTNNSADGNYDFILQVEVALNNGNFLPVGTQFIQFTGQTLEFPADFQKQMHSCLENFIGTRWAKSKIPSLSDLWGPMQRQQEYERVARELGALQEAGIFSSAAIDGALKIIAGKLRVPGQQNQ